MYVDMYMFKYVYFECHVACKQHTIDEMAVWPSKSTRWWITSVCAPVSTQHCHTVCQLYPQHGTVT